MLDPQGLYRKRKKETRRRDSKQKGNERKGAADEDK